MYVGGRASAQAGSGEEVGGGWGGSKDQFQAPGNCGGVLFTQSVLYFYQVIDDSGFLRRRGRQLSTKQRGETTVIEARPWRTPTTVPRRLPRLG